MVKLPEGENSAFKKFKERTGDITQWGEEDWEIVQPRLENFRTCIDIGAHVGLTTLRYAKHFKEVHSFEPIHWDLLTHNTSGFDNVTIYPFAVTSYSGQTEFYPNPQNTGAGLIPDEYNTELVNSRYGEFRRLSDIKPVQVDCTFIDNFSFRNVDFIKIDVEGHNIPLLEGAMETIKEHKPLIQIEESANQEVNNQTHKTLLGLGYQCFHRRGKPVDRFYQIKK